MSVELSGTYGTQMATESVRTAPTVSTECWRVNQGELENLTATKAIDILQEELYRQKGYSNSARGQQPYHAKREHKGSSNAAKKTAEPLVQQAKQLKPCLSSLRQEGPRQDQVLKTAFRACAGPHQEEEFEVSGCHGCADP